MDYFIEDIGNISINNGLVRIDCVRRLPGENEGEVQLQNKGQVVLPLASFVRVQGALARAAEEMVSRGILQRREAAEQAPATDEEVTAALESFEVDLDEDDESGADTEGESAAEKPKSSRRRSK
ncbi:hypothetical protein [Spiribacter onubensis]|uniref:Uncharacterized protein n=1 Tax=Spiribacter onubensis TaxID=3122420 RepID=A0ABV3SA96_9GAMM